MGAGERLGGRYRLVGRLGAGGMSEVWRGHDEVLDRPVAIKMLAGRSAADPALRRRIRAEARAAARLSHPHITGVYDYGEALGPDGEPVPFVVMELVDGVPMAACLAGGPALPWPAAVRACGQVAAALAAAHAHGIVHRDVKPANVMLTPAGAKVLDFGISALVGERDVDEDGSLFGTPAYLAPERLGGRAVTPACDVYGLGLLLYRTLTGHLPWSADTATQMLRAHLHIDPDPLPPVDGLPPEVAALCQRCLARDPDDRPTSEQAAAELTTVPGTAPDLTSVLPTAVLRLPAGRGPRRRVLVVTGLIASLGAVWAAAAWPTSTGTEHGAAAAIAEGFGPRPSSCTVEYQVSRDTGSAVTANLAITNTGSEPFHSWQLAFDLPGDQRLHRGTNATWHQDGRTVTARAGNAVLRPAATTRLTLTTGYHTSNPIPVTYHLNGVTCRAVVLGAPAGGSAAPRPARTTASDGSAGDRHADDGHGHGKGHGKRKGRD